jgi:hypothetical protein
VTGIRRGKLMCEVRELNRNKPEKPEKPAQN